MLMTEKHLTVAQVAKKYGKTSRQVYYAARKGLLASVRPEGAWELFFPESQLPEEWPVRHKAKKK